MKQILTLTFALLLFGCGTTPGHIQPGKISRISVGMTKQEVIGAIGPPESLSAGKGEETLFYVEERPWWQWARIRVRIVDGKVTEFGEVPK
jgi:outer membrane protein assembly factor BamE (lipoprotein component of BamABCDE complex)